MAKTSSEKATTKKVKEITCSCCGDTKKKTEFYTSQSKIFQATGKLCVCKDCVISLFDFYKKIYKDDEQATIYRICELLNIYYDEKLIEASYKDMEKRCIEEENNSSVMKFYMKNVAMPQYKGLTFEDRKIKYEHAKDIVEEKEIRNNELDENDKKSKEDIVRLLGYDPFNGYEIVDQKYLYNELIPYLDEDTLEDPFKIGVVLQIVINNNQIRKANIAINSLGKDIETMVKNSKEISALTDMTTKWNQQNDKLSKENNIALKHRGNSSSKNSTLGSMMKNLRELGFEKAEQDYYDMSKAYGMKFSADISNKSIMEILHFDEADMNNMFKMQREELQKLQEGELELKEQIRVLLIENKEKENKIKELEKGK